MRFYVVAIVWISLLLKGEGATVGPWVAVVDNVTGCPDETNLPSLLQMQIVKGGKYSRTVTNGTLNAYTGVSNELHMVLRLFEWKKGRWDVLAVRDMGGACDAFNTCIMDTWKLILEKSSVETFTEGSSVCAKPKVVAMAVPFDLPPIRVAAIPTFVYGTYRADMLVRHPNETKLGCFTVYANIVPKPKG